MRRRSVPMRRSTFATSTSRGRVNTRHDWATWNPDGSFVSMYVRESLAAHMIPVFTCYRMLQSAPSVGATEQARDLSNTRNPATMLAYWADYRLLLRRVAAAAGSHRVVIQVEPDLWGYLEQAHAVGLARAFALRLIALRDQLAPRVLLAYPLSVWGTDEDVTNSRPSLAQMNVPAAESAPSTSRSTLTSISSSTTSPSATRGTTPTSTETRRHGGGPPISPARTATSRASRRGPTPRLCCGSCRSATRTRTTPGASARTTDSTGGSAPGRCPTCAPARDAGVIGPLFGAGASGNTTQMTDHGFSYRLARRYEQHPLSLTQPL